jgi:outer membrane protein assembly factor BamE (lipoprotein component of BamABCDE complex)
MFFDTMARVRSKEVRDCDRRNARADKQVTVQFRRPEFAAKLVLAAGLALSLCGCIGYDGEVIHGYQLDQKSLDQIKVGSSAEQALAIMGNPSTTSTVGGDAWYYITQVTDAQVRFLAPHLVDQHVLAIYFDKQKKVERVANYGIQDGHIFDFVSRKTATGGADGDFVKGLFQNFMFKPF